MYTVIGPQLSGTEAEAAYSPVGGIGVLALAEPVVEDEIDELDDREQASTEEETERTANVA